MALSKLKAKATIAAVKKFTNRESALSTFTRSINEYQTYDHALKVISFYGIGGVGKTHLLKKLSGIALEQEDKQFKVISIDLESPHYNSLLDILLDIRCQLTTKADLFDYAVARFLVMSGRSIKEIRKSWIKEDSLLFDFQEFASGMTETVVPAKLIRKLIGYAEEKRARFYSKYKAQFDEIDNIPNNELISYLSYYLGLAIADEAAKNKLILFFDTLEALEKRRFFKVTKETSDRWLQECIGSAEKGLYVIASRNYIKWPDYEPEWNDYLEQHAIGALSDEDADYFLQHIPVVEPNIRTSIINSAKGLPLYLDLCATTYLIKKGDGKVIQASDFEFHQEEVIQRFLAHLDKEHCEAIKAMSVFSAFDQRLFASVTSALNISFPVSLYQDFCDSAYAESIEHLSGVNRIHKTIRAYLKDECQDVLVSSIFECVIQELQRSAGDKDFHRMFWLLDQIIGLDNAYSLDFTREQADSLLGQALLIIEYGYWNELLDKIETKTTNHQAITTKFAAYTLLLALCNRKQGKLEAARALYQSLAQSPSKLGLYQDEFVYHYAHIQHLLGDYAAAEPLYLLLAKKHTPSDRSSSVACLAKRQYADLKMLKGEFREASKIFKEMLQLNQHGDIWMAESNRFNGHVLRFNFQFEEALAHYTEAERIAICSQSNAMLGKVKTNFVEAYCYSNPNKALQESISAIELNTEAGAMIEVGKVYAATSIAHALLKNLDQALLDAERAKNIQTETGYKAGLLFALNAQAITYYLSEDKDMAFEVLDAMYELIREIKVYSFMTAHIEYLLSGKTSWGDFDWLDVNGIKQGVGETFMK
jgi:hypothetical protein